MSPPARPEPRLFAVAGAAFVVGASVYLALTAPLGGDYNNLNCFIQSGVWRCDDPSRSIWALIHANPGGFFAHQPPMGSFSLLLRAPFAGLAVLADGSDRLVYQLGALPCLAVVGSAGLLVARAMHSRGRPRWAQAIVVAGFLLNPLTFKALYFGHPEELLGAGLCVIAVMLASEERPALAGLVLGAAIATKDWALLALGPTLIAAPAGQRARLLVSCLATAGVLIVPMMLGNPHSFEVATRSISAIATRPGSVTPANVWWRLASTGPTFDLAVRGGRIVAVRGQGYALPELLGELTHPLVLVIALALSLLYWRRCVSRRPERVLMLLALIFLLRCVLDPFTYSYHHAPFLLALLAAEGLRRRVPLLSALSAAVLYLLSRGLAPATLNVAYLVFALPLAAVLATVVFAPGLTGTLSARLRISPRLPGVQRDLGATGG